MDRSRLLRYYLVAIVGSIVVFTVAYDVGMSVFEDRPRTLLEAFEIVLQTFTTTGYGQDAPWESTAMTLLVIAMQGGSLVLIFAAFPIVIVPLVEDALSTAPPTERPGLTDHVVVCSHSPRTRTLIDEFEARDVPYVVVEADRAVASDLHEADRPVVHGDPESADLLRHVGLADARAVVADGDDQVDLSVVMAAKEVAPSVPAYTVLEDESLARYHEHAGADGVFSPRELLGRGLANKVRTAVETELDDEVRVGRGGELRVREVPVRPGSELIDRPLGEVGIDDRTGIRVVGAWTRGEFRTPPLEDLVLDEHTVLLIVGGRAAVDALERSGPASMRRHGRRGRGDVVVAGHGVVGSTVVDALVRADFEPTVVDLADEPGVDVVGDVTDERVLRKADVDEAGTVVLALNDDATALLATFVVRDLAPDAELVVRAEEAANVRKLYRAGADYVLSLASVTGRLLAAALLDHRDVVTVDEPVAIARLPAAPVADRRLGELDARARTACTIVAVEHRDGRVDADIGEYTVLDERDYLLVAGLASDVQRLREVVEDGEWPGESTRLHGGDGRDRPGRDGAADADEAGDGRDGRRGTRDRSTGRAGRRDDDAHPFSRPRD